MSCEEEIGRGRIAAPPIAMALTHRLSTSHRDYPEDEENEHEEESDIDHRRNPVGEAS